MKRLGIVEGFYGTPWNQSDRLYIIDEISSIGFNTYIYAPKDDPYHRELWRSDYPKEELKQLIDTYTACKKNQMDFFFTISPGGNISYSSDTDLDAVYNKFLPLYKSGIKHFGIFFDDIAFNLPEGEDKRRFKTIDRAQNYFLKEFYKKIKNLDSEITLATCPTLYHGCGNEEYITRFTDNLPREIILFWTGREVCSQVLSAPDATLFREKTGHKPTYWDNYPVNDSVMKWEFHLGPYDKRDPELLNLSEGVILNPMEFSHSSLIALQTAADFFKNPSSYNKMESWKSAITKYIDPSIVTEYMHFAGYCFKSCIYPYFSNKQIMTELMEGMNNPKWNCGEFLLNEGHIGLSNANKLLKHRNNKFLKEALPWIDKYRLLMQIFIAYKKRKSILGSIKFRLLERKFLLNRYEIFQLDVFNEIDKK